MAPSLSFSFLPDPQCEEERGVPTNHCGDVGSWECDDGSHLGSSECVVSVDCSFLPGGERVPDPQCEEERGVPTNHCGDVGSWDCGDGSHLGSSECVASVDCSFLPGGERGPDPPSEEERGVPTNHCGVFGSVGRDLTGLRCPAPCDDDVGRSVARDGRGPGPPLGGWEVPTNHCEGVPLALGPGNLLNEGVLMVGRVFFLIWLV